MSVLVVTGTDTGVGKTIVTAALAAALLARGDTVAVFKPTQAGTEDGRGDIDVVSTLAGVGTAVEGIRLPDPMAPVAAARRAGVTLPDTAEHVAAVGRDDQTARGEVLGRTGLGDAVRVPLQMGQVCRPQPFLARVGRRPRREHGECVGVKVAEVARDAGAGLA